MLIINKSHKHVAENTVLLGFFTSKSTLQQVCTVCNLDLFF